jgi:restriction system protein
MPVPEYQAFMRPLLEVLADGKERPVREVYAAVAQHLQLVPDDMEEVLPSGKQLVWRNRVGWAKTYLNKAGLVDVPRRGVVRIAPAGREALNSREPIDNSYLRRFDSFRAFQRGAHETSSRERPAAEREDTESSTPDERLEELYSTILDNLTLELLDQVRQVDADFFERLVVRLLVAMGYGGSVRDAGRAVGRSGDNGIDGIIKQDPLGLDSVYIQAKRYAADRPVGPAQVRELGGALQMRKATKGVLITTSHFTSDAMDTARMIGSIVLVDGEQLARLMITHGIGVTTSAAYELKRIDSDFFEE